MIALDQIVPPLSADVSVIGFTTYLTLVNRIGSAKAGYATVLFPIVALTASTMLEGYQWTTLAVIGVALACLGNVVMFSWIELVLLGRWISLFAIGPSRPAATSLIRDVAL